MLLLLLLLLLLSAARGVSTHLHTRLPPHRDMYLCCIRIAMPCARATLDVGSPVAPLPSPVAHAQKRPVRVHSLCRVSCVAHRHGGARAG